MLAEHINGFERRDLRDFDKPRKCAYQKEMIDSNEQAKEMGQPK